MSIRASEPCDAATVVAWDFDGVLNRNIVDGRFVWADTFEADTGHPLKGFTDAVFAEGFDDVITGRTDLRDRVDDWARKAGYAPGADALLAYWFERDALPDPDIGPVMDDLRERGVRQVIVTNNEARRARYIEREMEFGPRVEHVFASGRMGVRKPDPAYFAHVTDALGVEPERMLLIDDHPDNVMAAKTCGWRTFHFTDVSRDRLRTVLGLGVYE